jgi:transposase
LSEQPKTEARKRYTREYKLEAVRLTTEGGISVAQAARDLGLNENTLHNWRRQLRPGTRIGAAGKDALSLVEENRQLRRDNQRLQQEITFLKRAAVWLAREAHRSTD